MLARVPENHAIKSVERIRLYSNILDVARKQSTTYIPTLDTLPSKDTL